MKLQSSAFNNGEEIPVKYTCFGPNISPPLSFIDVPAKAQSLVLTLEDVNAEGKPWVHWLVFNIPTTTKHVAEGQLPLGGVEGLANGGTYGYEGPCPRYFNGRHHYWFQLYALDSLLDLSATADLATVKKAMSSHILDQAELLGIAEGAKAKMEATGQLVQ
jgi:Raf kinase inhibitor-like YbhB/YbcL family protein